MEKEVLDMYKKIFSENISNSTRTEFVARDYLFNKFSWSQFAHQEEEDSLLIAFCAGLALAGNQSRELKDLQELHTYPERLAVPMEEETVEYIAEMAAQKGLTPGQMLGKMADKFISQYQADGGEIDGSGYCRPDTLGDWFQKLEPRKNFISWINNDVGENLTGIFLDAYQDPDEDTSLELEKYTKDNPGSTAEEADALLDLFSREWYALQIAPTTDEERKEIYKPTWEKQPPAKS